MATSVVPSPPRGKGVPRRRYWGPCLLAVIVACFSGVPAWFSASGDLGNSVAAEHLLENRPRRALLVPGLLTLSSAAAAPTAVWGEGSLRLDEYGRAVLPDGSLASSTGLNYEGVATFNGRPKVFIAGSTGELGRRVVLDFVRNGYSVYCGYRDDGRLAEVQYKNRTSPKYEMTVVPDALIETGREKELTEQLQDASVVVHVAGATTQFDVLRPTMSFDQDAPTRTDLNGTKALIDAAVAKGVKKFIYVSAVLTNARALGDDVADSDGFKNWNSFGNVLDCKHDAEEYLKSSGLDYTIIRPAPMTNDFPRDVGGLSFEKPDTILLKSGEVGSRISRDDVSLACLDAVFNIKASRGTFELVGVPRTPPMAREQWWVPRESSKAA